MKISPKHFWQKRWCHCHFIYTLDHQAFINITDSVTASEPCNNQTELQQNFKAQSAGWLEAALLFGTENEEGTLYVYICFDIGLISGESEEQWEDFWYCQNTVRLELIISFSIPTVIETGSRGGLYWAYTESGLELIIIHSVIWSAIRMEVIQTGHLWEIKKLFVFN